MSKLERSRALALRALCVGLMLCLCALPVGAASTLVGEEGMHSASLPLPTTASAVSAVASASAPPSAPSAASSATAAPASAVGAVSGAAPTSATPQPGWWLWLVLLAMALALAVVYLCRRRSKAAKAHARCATPVTADPPEPRPIRTEEGADGVALLIGNASHMGARENQQDSFAVSDISDAALCLSKGVFAVVADGMGGLSNGAQVSARVAAVMLRQFETGPEDLDPAIELLQMVQAANREVNQYLQGSGAQSGSTVVAARIRGNALYFVSVGDSRIYLARGGGLTQLNREHTYAADLDEQAARGVISLAAARANPQRRALTSYIGMGELAKIDRSLSPLPLLRGDRVLLLSDGVFGTISEQEILQAAQLDAPQAAERIQQLVLAKKKPTQDNMTAVVLQCV